MRTQPVATPQVPITVRLSFTRGTKNTYRYDASDKGAAIRTLYVQRSALGTSQPSWLVVRVEPSTAFSAPSKEGV